MSINLIYRAGDRVTYIKPETVFTPPNVIEEILQQGFVAAQKQDWLEVSNVLNALPQKKTEPLKKQLVLGAKDWQTAFDLALSMLLQGEFQHKWEIAKIFPRLGKDIIEPLSLMALDETVEPEVRWFMCQILGHFAEQSVVLVLVQLLQQSSDRELMEMAGKTLTKIGDQAVEALIDLISQPEYTLLAVQSLSYIRTTATISPLIDVTNHPEAGVRAIAVSALGSFHDRRIPPVLLAALEDKASQVRQEAAIALGFRADLCEEINLVEQLQPLLYDLNLAVCRQTAVSLGRMGRDEANLALLKVLQAETTPASFKSDLIKALGWSRQASGITYLGEALINASELVMQEIIVVLGRTSTPELKLQAARVLTDFYHRQSGLAATIEQTLATSLGQLGDPSTRSVLEQLATSSDRKVQLHAVSALKKLSINNH
ncbi:MAG: HEAT repeat domain-containing protein [Cyanobacteria bacterium J06623_7]